MGSFPEYWIESMIERPNLLPLSERIEKTNPTYKPAEDAAFDNLYPHNSQASRQLHGQPLSVEQARLIHPLLPTTDALTRAMSDEDGFLDTLKKTPLATQRKREDFWRTTAGLPLSATEKDVVFHRLSEKSGTDDVPMDLDDEEKVAAFTPVRTRLPYGALPRLDTFLTNVKDANELGIPPAVITIKNNATGMAEQVILSQTETAVALNKMQGWLEHIQKNMDTLSTNYKRAKGLSEEAIVPAQEIKNYYLTQLSHTWTRQLAHEKLQDQGDPNNHEYTLQFTQYKRGLDPEVREVIRSIDSVEQFFKEKQKTQETELQTPPMIELSAVAEHLTGGAIFVEDVATPLTVPTYHTTPGRNTETLNELQQAYIAITHATKSGDWTKASEIYVQYLEYWPQYLEHRLAAYDIWDKYQAGVILHMPETILSIASGPHEELRAQGFLAEHIPNYPMPQVYSLDASPEMLAASTKTIPSTLRPHGIDILGDMNDITVDEDSMDMVECSSFDNLQTDAQRKTLITKSLAIAKDDGLLRFMVEQPLSTALIDVLQKHGVTILEQNTIPRLTEETRAKIRDEKGADVLRRIEDKLQRHKYFVAQKTTAIDMASLTEDMQNVPTVFAETAKRSATAVQKELKRTTNIEGEALDYNICLAVAANPTYFLGRHLEPQYLMSAIKGLKQDIDAPMAMRLWKTYGNNPDLAPYTASLLETIGHLPEVKRQLSSNLLHHPDPQVQEYMKFQMAENPELFIDRLLDDRDASTETLTDILDVATYDEKLVKRIGAHITKLFQTGDTERLQHVFDTLPPNIELDLPLSMRFSTDFEPLYFRFGTGTLQRDTLNDAELKKLMQLPSRYAEQKTTFLPDAITAAIHSNDPDQVRRTLTFCIQNSTDPLIMQILDGQKKSLAQLAGISLEHTPREQHIGIRDFMDAQLGIPYTPEAKKADIHQVITGRYLDLREKFRTQRVRIENQEPLIQDAVDELITSLIQETGLPPYEVISYLWTNPSDIREKRGQIDMIRNRYMQNNFWGILRKNGETEEKITTIADTIAMGKTSFRVESIPLLLAYIKTVDQSQVPEEVWQKLANRLDFLPPNLQDKRRFVTGFVKKRYDNFYFQQTLKTHQETQEQFESMVRELTTTLHEPVVPVVLQIFGATNHDNTIVAQRTRRIITEKFWDMLETIDGTSEDQIDARALQMAQYIPKNPRSSDKITIPLLLSYIARREDTEIPLPFWKRIVEIHPNALTDIRGTIPADIKNKVESTLQKQENLSSEMQDKLRLASYSW